VTTKDDELADGILAASRALVAVAARSLSAAPEEVTLPQYRVLVVLETRGPQRPTDLATELDVAPSSITRLCDRLVKKGLVKRRARPANRRELTIEITEAGSEVVGSVTAARRRDIRRVVRRIPEARRSAVLTALRRFSEAAGEDVSPASPLGWPV
jgi:DNA-binding MarR family transcriptional regulator